MGVKHEIQGNALTQNNHKLMTLSITINNEKYEIEVPPTETLVVLLRDYLQLTGTKMSCSIGRCGACSVLVEGELVNACLMMAYQVNGKSITTIEGLQHPSIDDVQQAFLKEGGFQCGYCTSGMVLAVKTLLEKNASPQESEIKEALSGNLCRCTGYGGIIRAVQSLIPDANG
jgi:xanthine dehydrogenase E subunit